MLYGAILLTFDTLRIQEEKQLYILMYKEQ